MKTDGIHHITAIVGHPQENIDFYAGVLGLRLVKKTVNFDDPGTYHFYFGDDRGTPGTLITFFPWQHARRGKVGGGQVGVTVYAIPSGAIPFWEERLKKFRIDFKATERFGERYLEFEDVHGLKLALVEREEGRPNSWSFGDVTPDVAIKGFAGAELYSLDPERTAEAVEKLLGLKRVGEDENVIRFKSSAAIGNTLDIKRVQVERGYIGVGTVHHIAWRARDEQQLREWQRFVQAHRFLVTDVRDRNYFKSIYFREDGEILFEIATDPPGFMRDEAYESLGQELKLPPQYERFRDQLERRLIRVEVREIEDRSSEQESKS